MKVVVQNRQDLPPAVASALDAMAATINETSNTNQTPEGRVLHTVLSAYHNTTQSISDSAWTPINFNAEDDLRGQLGVKIPVGVHSNTVSPNKFVVPRGSAGRIRMNVRVVFAANGTGERGIRFLKNDSVFSYPLFHRAAPTNATIMSAYGKTYAVGGDVLTVDVFQSSGGPLNVGATTRDGQSEIEIEFP